MTRTARRRTRRSTRYLAIAAMALGLLAVHVSGAAAFDPKPIPPGGPAHVAQMALSWGGGVGDATTCSLCAPANDPS
jgi:hypothetical protein